ncbi:hypothetical protein GE21DRAFT_1016710 [Neurospora crassa]|nr:hypothetical protein GE21DRAFT_1016710 [Neurospora crassa]
MNAYPFPIQAENGRPISHYEIYTTVLFIIGYNSSASLIWTIPLGLTIEKDARSIAHEVSRRDRSHSAIQLRASDSAHARSIS